MIDQRTSRSQQNSVKIHWEAMEDNRESAEFQCKSESIESQQRVSKSEQTFLRGSRCQQRGSRESFNLNLKSKQIQQQHQKQFIVQDYLAGFHIRIPKLHLSVESVEVSQMASRESEESQLKPESLELVVFAAASSTVYIKNLICGSHISDFTIYTYICCLFAIFLFAFMPFIFFVFLFFV